MQIYANFLMIMCAANFCECKLEIDIILLFWRGLSVMAVILHTTPFAAYEL